MKVLKHNARRCHGCGTCFIGCPDGEKESPNVNYVPMAVAAGARVYTRAKAERVAIRNGRAAGLSGTLLDETGKQARARIDVDAKVVVLSAGAFHTPVMLLHNRIGNSSGQVGRNLSIHPAVRVNAEMPDDVRGWIGVPQGTYIDDFAADGIMLEGIFMPPAGGAPMFPYVGMRHKELAARFIKLAAYGVMIGDTSRGRVLADKLRPVILYNLNREDTRRMLRGLAVMSRIFFAAGAKTVFPNLAGAMTISERDIARIEDRKPNPRDMEMMAFHPLGTCRMGPDPRTSVVGPNLECHDVPGLFVVDGSVFPSSLGVNPQETIMAFATKAAAELADARSTYF
jgi:choline dehydrogenase-like flavoprotein